MAYDSDKRPDELTALTSLEDTDNVIVGDASDAQEVAKRITWANIKATLKTYFDTLYAAVSHTHTKSEITDFSEGDYATADQGTKADSAVQPGDLAEVATSGDYNDLSNTPDLSLYDNLHTEADSADFPATGDADVLYLETSTGLLYRWNGSGYSTISAQLALGETASTAYRGDRGKTAYDHSQVTSGNPHNVTAADIGVEEGATADQTDLEIETAYNTRVAIVSQAIAEAGTSTTVYRWTPQRIAQAIAALVSGGGNVTSGDGAPASTPSAVGAIYVDTTNAAIYFATGTTDSDDWSIALNSGTGTKGDILAHNGTKYVSIGVGSNGQVLTADSTQTAGVKWAAGGSGGGNGTAVSSGAGAPATTPSAIGDRYYDTTNKRVYHAFGTSSSADWRYVETST